MSRTPSNTHLRRGARLRLDCYGQGPDVCSLVHRHLVHLRRVRALQHQGLAWAHQQRWQRILLLISQYCFIGTFNKEKAQVRALSKYCQIITKTRYQLELYSMAAVGHHVPPGLTCTTLHMYWSTSSPSSRADLLQGGVTLDTSQYNTQWSYLHTGHFHTPFSQLSLR